VTVTLYDQLTNFTLKTGNQTTINSSFGVMAMVLGKNFSSGTTEDTMFNSAGASLNPANNGTVATAGVQIMLAAPLPVHKLVVTATLVGTDSYDYGFSAAELPTRELPF
jgi:hypothetical protein